MSSLNIFGESSIQNKLYLKQLTIKKLSCMLVYYFVIEKMEELGLMNVDLFEEMVRMRDLKNINNYDLDRITKSSNFHLKIVPMNYLETSDSDETCIR